MPSLFKALLIVIRTNLAFWWDLIRGKQGGIKPDKGRRKRDKPLQVIRLCQFCGRPVDVYFRAKTWVCGDCEIREIWGEK